MFQKLTKLRILLVIVAAVFLVSCATFDVQVTASDRLTYMYKTFNAQWEDYQSMAANPNTTEAQKVIMRQKKPVLDSLAVLIPAFDQGLQAGISTPEQEQAIYDLLNSLGGD